MADPICRWRNPYVNTIVELVKILPHNTMSSDKFRAIIEERWPGFLHTPYQLACQVGLYYESEDGIYHPRFDHDINEEEAFSYMKKWIVRYYVPNPYTRSMRTSQYPQPFLASIIKYVYEHPDNTELHYILEAVFQEKIGNIDIISNVLNTYTDFVKVDAIGNVELTVKAIDFMKNYIDRNDKKAFFDSFSESNIIEGDNSPRQQIFYGAPGTGKSHEINRLTREKAVIRTTFHPDSDYSTFVGAYKPTSIEVPVRDVTGKIIIENGKQVTENRIVYEFVEQAFLQAYTNAWKAYANAEAGTQPLEQYLVIEEINRGNCAQIFGDLFQLLDRNSVGFSEYPITADKDMKKQLAKAFKDMTIADADGINAIYKKDVVSQVLSGEILLLPNNLYIWATMNTSDQSLFPIDSAFKRRWDWKYIPISEGRDETGERLGYKIKIKGNLYDWWEFVEKINKDIYEQTKSEDKKIGYFFCKAKNGIVDADMFVSKVIFYLWNDVFKDQDVASIFGELTFSDFYDSAIKNKVQIKEDNVETFLKGLEIEPIAEVEDYEESDEEDDEEISDEEARAQRKESLVSIQIPNHPIIYTKDLTIIEAFAKSLEYIGIDRIVPIIDTLKYHRIHCPVISTQKYPTIESEGSGYSYYQVGELFVIKGCKTYTYIRILEDLNDMLNVGLSLETK